MNDNQRSFINFSIFPHSSSSPERAPQFSYSFFFHLVPFSEPFPQNFLKDGKYCDNVCSYNCCFCCCCWRLYRRKKFVFRHPRNSWLVSALGRETNRKERKRNWGRTKEGEMLANGLLSTRFIMKFSIDPLFQIS